MNQALRIGALVAVLLALSGCNMVVSEEPWFAAADAVDAPDMRDGLWRNDDPDCPFDDARPAERWPDCAEASFVRGGESWMMAWDSTDDRGRRRRTFAGWEPGVPPRHSLFVTNGDHLIVQVDAAEALLPERSPEDDPPLEPPEVEASANGASGEPVERYLYFAFRPAGHDDAGKVTATESWGVRCGPIPGEEPSHSLGRRKHANRGEEHAALSPVTDRPFSGLTVIGSNCVAESVEAVRRAAVLSEGLENKGRSRWVREGWR